MQDNACFLMVLLVLLFFLCLLFLLRIGVLIEYQEGKLTIQGKIWGKTFGLYPRTKRQKKSSSSKEQKPDAVSVKKSQKERGKQAWEGLKTIIPLILRLLRVTHRKVKFTPCTLKVVCGGENPDEVARLYGRVEEAVWTLMPRLEELLWIPDPQIQVRWDFDATETRVSAKLGLSLRLAECLWLGFGIGLPLLRWLLRQKRKNR